MTKFATSVLRAVSVLFVLLALASRAKADTYTTFEATGTFEDGSSLSGTVTIDMTIGLATAVDLTVATEYSALFFDSSEAGGTLTTWVIGPMFSATEGFYTPLNFAGIEYSTADGADISLVFPASGLSALPATALPIVPEFDVYVPPDYTSFEQFGSYYFFSPTQNALLIDGLLQPIFTGTIRQRFGFPPPRLTF